MLLQTTSEELACPRDDLSTCRKEELHRLLLEHIPNILSILAGELLIYFNLFYFFHFTVNLANTYCLGHGLSTSYKKSVLKMEM